MEWFYLFFDELTVVLALFFLIILVGLVAPYLSPRLNKWSRDDAMAGLLFIPMVLCTLVGVRMIWWLVQQQEFVLERWYMALGFIAFALRTASQYYWSRPSREDKPETVSEKAG
jgi:fructose-specific phosphotransferase system IIC component